MVMGAEANAKAWKRDLFPCELIPEILEIVIASWNIIQKPDRLDREVSISKGFTKKLRTEKNQHYDLPFKIWYDSPPVCEEYILPKDPLLRGWASYLDGLSKLPNDRQTFLISKAIGKSIVIKQVEKNFSEDELAQLTKLKKKMDIFKVKLEEHF